MPRNNDFDTNKIGDFIYIKDGYRYDLEEMGIDLSHEDIYKKIINGELLSYHELLTEELYIEDHNELDIRSEVRNRRIVIADKNLTMTSDHDGYCSGSECEFNAKIDYMVRFVDNIDDISTDERRCECDINIDGSGYCDDDELSKKYELTHDCRHVRLERHIIERRKREIDILWLGYYYRPECTLRQLYLDVIKYIITFL